MQEDVLGDDRRDETAPSPDEVNADQDLPAEDAPSGDDDLLDSPSAEAFGPAGAGRLPGIARGLLQWSGFGVVAAVFLRPILIAPIVGDDFINPWFQFPKAGMSFTGIWSYAVTEASHAGHFNYLGQLVGCFLYASWTWMMASLGIRYTAIYALVKLLVYLLTVASIGAFVREVATMARRPVGVWRSRLFVAIPLFGVLQIHEPWSHDPVATYPTSGFASAALGFLVLTFGLRAYRTLDRRAALVTALVGLGSILYYEINVAAVAALVPLAVWGWYQHGGRNGGLRKVAVPTLITIGVPAVCTVALQRYANSQSVDYTGTDVAVGSGTMSTFKVAFRGTVPGAGWDLSREFLAGPIAVRGAAVAVLVMTGAIGFWLLRRYPNPVAVGGIATPVAAAGGLAAVTYWIGATMIQSSTAKVQNEITRVGVVYNFYAVGTAALAVLVVLGCLLAPRRLVGGFVTIAGWSIAIGFISVQYMINWNLSDRFADYTLPNQWLHLAFSENPPMAERCEILTTWEAIEWPEYVEVTMIDGLQAANEYFHGEPFCEGFKRSS